MTSQHPFFIIGSIGMALTALIHLIAMVVADAINHAAFFVLYLVFAIMIFLGSGKTRRLERIRVRNRY